MDIERKCVQSRCSQGSADLDGLSVGENRNYSNLMELVSERGASDLLQTAIR